MQYCLHHSCLVLFRLFHRNKLILFIVFYLFIECCNCTQCVVEESKCTDPGDQPSNTENQLQNWATLRLVAVEVMWVL